MLVALRIYNASINIAAAHNDSMPDTEYQYPAGRHETSAWHVGSASLHSGFVVLTRSMSTAAYCLR